MTIAAGFKCSDGILLASDTLYSGAHQRVYGRKLWILHDDDPVVVFGGAANSVAALTRARDEIKRKIRVGDSLQRTLDGIDTALKKVNDKFSPPPAWPDVQALVVIRAEGETRLFKNDGQKIALSPVDSPTVCVGIDALGDYFAESLFADGLPLTWAKAVAAHLIWNCKKYASGYCGGDTHFIEVPFTGPVVAIDDQTQIAVYEKHLRPLVDAIESAKSRTAAAGLTVGLREGVTVGEWISAALTGVEAKGSLGSLTPVVTYPPQDQEAPPDQKDPKDEK